MKVILDRLPGGLRSGTPVLVSAAAVGLSAIVLAYGISAIGKSLIQPSLDATQADPLAALAVQSTELLENSRKRFEGRSMYSLPPMPPRKPRVVDLPKPVDPPKVDLGPAPPPALYTGPAPTSVIGNYVFFATLGDENKSIKVGESKNGISVISVNAPYSVKLGYQRGEYTVSVWARAEDRLTKGELAPSRVTGVVGNGAVVNGAGVNGTGVNGTGVNGTGVNGTGVNGAAAGSAAGVRGVPGGLPASGADGGKAEAGLAGSGSGIGAGMRPGQSTKLPRSQPPTANPLTDIPGDQPGGDVPSGTGPEGEPQVLPSAAMKPQQFPPPAPGEVVPPPEYVDRESLPAPLLDAQISAMTIVQARSALLAINATDSLSVDDHSRARLDHERALLRTRLDRNP